MRTLELLIPITLSIYILLPLFSGRENPRIINFLTVLAVIEVVVHLIFEGYRWPMISIYLLTGLLFFTTIPELRQPTMGEFDRMSSSAVGLVAIFIILVGSTLLPILLPVPTIPIPDGKYKVSTQTIVLTDESRREIYSEKDEPRKFLIKVWYPATPGPNAIHSPWMEHVTIYGRAIARAFGLPGFVLDHLSLVESPA